MINLIFGIILALAISLISYKLKLLTTSGIITTFLLALVIYTFGTWQWTLPIVTFFVLSSLLSKFRKRRNPEVEKYFEKLEQRDHLQVLANGGLASVLVTLNYFYPSKLLYIVYVSMVAAVCADTWSTEIGTSVKTKTVDILSFREINQGISGGISLPGIFASFAGAFVISATSLPWIESNYQNNIIIITAAGFIGSIADSFLGSSLQAQYECKVCNSVTERKIHCGKEADLLKGKRWINNDVVNFGAGISGGIFSLIIYDIING
ncbi:MAG: hypothetical protein A2V93_01660 [Ignavibacteria bacterium RBG_16_34_14]|nr:MAG: hypothetical protein A2V93_01660 [Ignavibacteria bacterium RBG_16_34_14]